jgi:hypothetical protein
VDPVFSPSACDIVPQTLEAHEFSKTILEITERRSDEKLIAIILSSIIENYGNNLEAE